MQLYNFSYELQNETDLTASLSEFCDDIESNDDKSEFVWKIPFTVEKRYTVSEEENRINETLTATSYYLLCSVSAAIIAIRLVRKNFDLVFADLIWYILLLPGAVVLFIIPYLLMNHQPTEFHPKKQPLSGLFRFQPSPFLRQTQISPIVYLNSLTVGVILLPVVFPNINILATVFPVSIFALSLIWRDGSDPASNNIVGITALSILPFSIPIINLTVYSQYEKMVAQNIAFLNQITPPQFTGMNDLLLSIFQSQTIGLLLLLPTGITVPLWVLKLISENTDQIDVYKMPEEIDDKKHLRAGILLLFSTYVGSSLLLLVTQLVGYPLVPVESTVAGLLVYWPLFILVPIWFTIWHFNRYKSSDNYEISSQNLEFTFDGVPVLFAELGNTVAFPISDGMESAIVLNKQLRKELTDNEIAAICYHELYHIKHDSVKYQSWIDVPVIGYILFFSRSNFSELYNEEYAADEFAAKKVGPDTVLSALATIKSIEIGQSGSPVREHLNDGWRGYLKLLFSPPVLSLYSPPRHLRVNRLNQEQDLIDN